MNYLNTQYLLDKRPSGMPKDDCWKVHQDPITSLEKNEILNKVMKLNNSVNSENIIEIKQENLSDNTEINNLKRIYKSKKTKNLVIDKDNLHKVDTDKTHLDNIIHKIFE